MNNIKKNEIDIPAGPGVAVRENPTEAGHENFSRILDILTHNR